MAQSPLPGCYAIRYYPAITDPEVLFYEGTFRVIEKPSPHDSQGEEQEGSARPKPEGGEDKDSAVSEFEGAGDLYIRRTAYPYGRDPRNQPLVANGKPLQDPRTWFPSRIDTQIPIFPRKDYFAYLRAKQIVANGHAEQIHACVEVDYFDHTTKRWQNPGDRLIQLGKSQAKPSVFYNVEGKNHEAKPGTIGKSLEGKVFDQQSGEVVGRLVAFRIDNEKSHPLRRARLVISKVGHTPNNEVRQLADALKEVYLKEEIQLKCERAPQDVVDDALKAASKPGGTTGTWKVSELHRLMVEINKWWEKQTLPGVTSGDIDPLDLEWVYHLLCVDEIEDFPRGVMFDTSGTDSNNMPREGAAIGCAWKFEDQEKLRERKEFWGKAKGALWGNEKVFHRVAVHEVGHAMGLGHSHVDYRYMNTTDAIAEMAQERRTELDKAIEGLELRALLLEAKSEELDHETVKKKLNEATQEGRKEEYQEKPKEHTDERKKQIRGKVEECEKEAHKVSSEFERIIFQLKARRLERLLYEFPTVIEPSFGREDSRRLRLAPDWTVRPGTEFNDDGPMFADAHQASRAIGMRLEVASLLSSVPLGAPVRVNLKLVNEASKRLRAPAQLGFSSGSLSGEVVDTDGRRRSFWPVKISLDDANLGWLEPKQSIRHSITLLRGCQGSLFPHEGRYRIEVRLEWQGEDGRVYAQESSEVVVSGHANEARRALAESIVLEPDTLLSLAIGGEQFETGNKVIEAATQDEVLRPHWAVTWFKQRCLRQEDQEVLKARLGEARGLIDSSTILSLAEIESLVACLIEIEDCRGQLGLELSLVKQVCDPIQEKLRAMLSSGEVEHDVTVQSIQKALSDLLHAK